MLTSKTLRTPALLLAMGVFGTGCMDGGMTAEEELLREQIGALETISTTLPTPSNGAGEIRTSTTRFAGHLGRAGGAGIRRTCGARTSHCD